MTTIETFFWWSVSFAIISYILFAFNFVIYSYPVRQGHYRFSLVSLIVMLFFIVLNFCFVVVLLTEQNK